MATDHTFQPAIVVPVYNHEVAIPNTLSNLLKSGLPILLVDDGSDSVCEQVLQTLATENSERVFLHRLPYNSGKGAAVKAGLRWLANAGYSHGLQIDADGQHDANDVPKFIAAAESNPEHVVTGYPQYDDSVPLVRFYCRYLTHVLVWLSTLSFEVKDTMCGFRVYPIKPILPLLAKCGDRMDFDSEIMVRWVWLGNNVTNLPTKVHYPKDGVSHFLLWKDNSLMTWMHIRLVFGMLIRSPKLLWRKLRG
ncbi:glycosyltransferase family 2 protein [Methylophaga sp. OBS3]|uniref:glycosyltransferase family 2 protein n=1 Tax=Methylophaga sp. OBS3 TaxID=2991934 RepID=UPI00225B43EF|nr:glycosyltransferase family 2 protein [Methylophaga sp. OBS3]MCX4189068.1 glycosyltransferase family 2 protein [Methylophaga sp. OBS3]